MHSEIPHRCRKIPRRRFVGANIMARAIYGKCHFTVQSGDVLMLCSQILKREEESRFERLGSKLKAQRLEAEERKKEREVKLTDRVPPPKRPRSGGCKSRLWLIFTNINSFISLSVIRGSAYSTKNVAPKNTIRSLQNPKGYV